MEVLLLKDVPGIGSAGQMKKVSDGYARNFLLPRKLAVVATEGADASAITAVTLLAGVDAILTAAPNQSASTLLSPWSLNTSGGEGEAAQQ